MKKIILIMALLFVLSISAVSAEDNATEDSSLSDLNATISIPEEIASYNPQATDTDIEINAPDDYNESINIYVDNELIGYGPLNKSFGLYSFDYSVGDHLLLVNFPQTSIYKELNLTQKFTIADPLVKISNEDNVISAGITASPDITGTFTVFVDNSEFKKVNIQEAYKQTGYSTALNLDHGTYNITAIYSGDNKYKKVEKSKIVTVKYPIYTSYNRFQYYEDKIFEITPPYDIKNKKIDVLVDGKSYASTYDEEYQMFNVNLGELSLGEHKLSITYNGDSKYPKQTIEKTIVVYTTVNLNYSKSYGENGTFSLKIPTNEKGNLSVYLSSNRITSPNPDKLYGTAELINGTASVSFSNLPVGKYYYFAHYDGTTDVEDTSSSFTIFPKIIMPTEMKYGTDTVIYAIADENTSGRLVLSIENHESVREYFIDIVNGSGNCTFKYLPISRLAISTDFISNEETLTGDVLYLTVKGYNPIISQNKDVAMYYCDGTAYSVKLKNEYGRFDEGIKVTFKIGSQKYTSYTNNNGIAKITIKELPGKYTITATYNKVTVKNKLVVKKILTLNNVKVKKSSKQLILTAKLAKKLKGKQITFKFNGKSYKTKTNSKGIAKVTIKSSVLKKLKVGKKITYQATYQKSTVKKTVKVQK